LTPLVDIPPKMRTNARAISVACVLVVLLTVAHEFWEIAQAVQGQETNPWFGLSLTHLSSAALGIDAFVVGVRKRRDLGPTITNLPPGGWAAFATTLWIIAVPAYFLSARRRARRGADDDPREAAGLGSWLLIAVYVAIGLFTLIAALVT
jgi:hypothetical protein